MNKFPNDIGTEEKTSHPILFILGLLAIVVIVGYALCGNPFTTSSAENDAKQPAGITINADNPGTGNIDDPVGETFECELTFLSMNRHDITKPQPTHPDHPTTPDSNKLQADTEYIIQFDFPDMLRAEIENDSCNFDVYAKYEFEVEDSHRAHFQVKLFNKDTGNLYVANGAILAADNLCLKHCFDKGNNLICHRPEFENDHFAFSVYTSALPDAGPKVTTDTSSGGWGYSLHYTIAGMTADDWDIPYK